MNHVIKTTAFIMCLVLSVFTQIDNVQFKDLEGNSYDLYELLGEGKHVFIMMSFNG